MALISFTRQHRDRSNSTGFQFEFFCDLCSTSHMTSFQYDGVGVAASVLSTAELLMRKNRNLGAAGQQINQLMRGKAWEDAYANAVVEAKKLFKQCPRCNGWVCPDNCWNPEIILCRKCAPDLSKEAPAMKAHAGKWQLLGKAFLEDQTGGRDMSMPQLANCPHCHARNQGGKFCVDCGKKIIVDVICKQCDTVWPSVTAFKFCPNCGSGITEYAEPGSQKTLAEEAAAAAQTAEAHAESIGVESGADQAESAKQQAKSAASSKESQ